MPISNAKNSHPFRCRIAWLICLCLLLVAGLVLAKQFLYLHDIGSSISDHTLPFGWPANEDLATMELAPMAMPMEWSDSTLPDKMNGKAELYFAAGFLKMTSASFAMNGNKENWFEVQLFEQSNTENAFAVYSQQRRSQGVALPWAAQGYATSNAIYVQQGNYYLEISATSSEPALMTAMQKWARHWLKQQPGQNYNPASAFAGQGLVQDSIMLLAKDAFGLPGLDQVWMAEYENSRQYCLLFLRQYANEQDTLGWMAQLEAFWLEQGAVRLEYTSSALPDLRVYQLEGMYQLVCISHNFLLGVHEAESLDTAVPFLTSLYDHLQESR